MPHLVSEKQILAPNIFLFDKKQSLACKNQIKAELNTSSLGLKNISSNFQYHYLGTSPQHFAAASLTSSLS